LSEGAIAESEGFAAGGSLISHIIIIIIIIITFLAIGLFMCKVDRTVRLLREFYILYFEMVWHCFLFSLSLF
jgi:hypothetical protein